jgi:hypothetical protein
LAYSVDDGFDDESALPPYRGEFMVDLQATTPSTPPSILWSTSRRSALSSICPSR